MAAVRSRLVWINMAVRRFLQTDLGWLFSIFGVWRLVLALWAGWVNPAQILPAPASLGADQAIYTTFRLAQPATGPLAHFLLDPWYRWDAGWYLGMALGLARQGASGFAPLYPFLVRLVMPLAFGNALAAGLLVSNVSLLIALWLLLDQVRPLLGAATARLAVVLVLLFPLSLFLAGAYSESLFLCFVLATLAAARGGHWGWAAAWAACATLTRFMGLVLVVPLLWEALHSTRRPNSPAWLPLAALLAAPAAVAAYFIWQRAASAPAALLPARFVQSVSWPWESVANVWLKMVVGPNWPLDWVNLLLLAVCLGSSWAMLKRLRPTDGLYALTSLALLASIRIDGTLLLFGLTRYIVVIYPLFVVWANGLQARRWVQPLVLLSCAAGQLGAVWLFVHWYFVG